MAKRFIILGEINKKILLPIILICAQVVYIIINEFAFKEQKYNILEMLMFSLGQISIRFVPCILKISNEKRNESLKLTKKNKCLHYFILCLIFYFYLVLGNFVAIFGSDELTLTQTNLLPHNEFLLMVILESILLISISICLLKYKYFKHHIISLVVYVIFGTSCYVVNKTLDSKQNLSIDKNFFIVNTIRLFHAAVEATYLCYQKYMMEKLYYPYWNIALVPGIMFFFPSVFVIFLEFIGIKYFSDFTFFSVISYFKETNSVSKAIWKLIITFIFHIIISPLTILIIFYFSPNFILIVYQFTSITKDIISYSNNLLSLISIPFYIIQIFALLIYLEVLEFNFCDLNKNTKRNIELRAKEDLLNKNRYSSADINCIDVDSDYGIEIPEKNENDIEPEENLK